MTKLQWPNNTRLNGIGQPQASGQTVTVDSPQDVFSRTNPGTRIRVNADKGVVLKIDDLTATMTFNQPLDLLVIQCGAIPTASLSVISDVTLTARDGGRKVATFQSVIEVKNTSGPPFMPSIVCAAPAGRRFDNLNIDVVPRSADTNMVVGTVMIRTAAPAAVPAVLAMSAGGGTAAAKVAGRRATKRRR